MLNQSKYAGPQAAIVGLLVAALLVSGCGGGSSEPAPSKKTFLNEADKICAQTEPREFAAAKVYAARHAQYGAGAESQEAMIGTVVPRVLRKELEELDNLHVPSGDDGQVHELLAAIEVGVEDLEQNPSHYLRTPGQYSFEEAENLAREYGLRVCGGR